MNDRDRDPHPGADRSVWFVGDLDDPWVAAIADALPADARGSPARATCPTSLGRRRRRPRRSWCCTGRLDPVDAERLARLRVGTDADAAGGPLPRPARPARRPRALGRRWSTRSSPRRRPATRSRGTLVGPATTAPRAGRRRARGRGSRSSAPTVELRQTLADACEAAGLPGRAGARLVRGAPRPARRSGTSRCSSPTGRRRWRGGRGSARWSPCSGSPTGRWSAEARAGGRVGLPGAARSTWPTWPPSSTA